MGVFFPLFLQNDPGRGVCRSRDLPAYKRIMVPCNDKKEHIHTIKIPNEREKRSSALFGARLSAVLRCGLHVVTNYTRVAGLIYKGGGGLSRELVYIYVWTYHIIFCCMKGLS